jgi:hypothetical protein
LAHCICVGGNIWQSAGEARDDIVAAMEVAEGRLMAGGEDSKPAKVNVDFG